MSTPSSEQLFAALDGTWPAAEYLHQPPWLLRRGAGGGQRVSAATASGDCALGDIAVAEAKMREMNQTPLFLIRPGDETLDGWLENKKYDVVDPVAVYVCNCRGEETPNTNVSSRWPPLDSEKKIWQAGGIGPARIAVMDRVKGKKTCLTLASETGIAGTAFLALHGGIAMLHALEIDPKERRKGIGRQIMRAALGWGACHGADWFSLMVTRANRPANALYSSLGMVEVSRYHYRRATKVSR